MTKMTNMESIVADMLANGVDPNVAFLDALTKAKEAQLKKEAAAKEQEQKNKEIADARHKAARGLALYMYKLGVLQKDDIDKLVASTEMEFARTEPSLVHFVECAGKIPTQPIISADRIVKVNDDLDAILKKYFA